MLNWIPNSPSQIRLLKKEGMSHIERKMTKKGETKERDGPMYEKEKKKRGGRKETRGRE